MTKIKFFITAVLFSLLFLSGCGTQKSVDVTPKTVASDWYTNPPVSTDTILYAVGEAQNKDEAIKNALNNMASTLSVSIASQFNSKELVQEGTKSSYQSTVSNAVQSEVKKRRISH